MIQGRVTSRGVPTVSIPVAGSDWPATIDTGFNGDLELPEALRMAVNPRFTGQIVSSLAGGQVIEEDAFVVDFPFDGEMILATATFVPAGLLQTNSVYTATITTGARSLGGVALETSHSWTFTTALIALRSAQTYSVLGAGVTNTGPTSLSGDLGVSTGAPIMGGTLITVGGTTHAGDAAAIRARADLLVAYNAAKALTGPMSLATLDGRTLTAGIYTSNAAALGLSTMLTLDGEGDPNAVFIFQVDAALNTGATTSNVTLIREARAANVFWQVSGAVTLGAGSQFQGTILGLAAITVGAGTVLEGKALSINGDVTLATNTIGD